MPKTEIESLMEKKAPHSDSKGFDNDSILKIPPDPTLTVSARFLSQMISMGPFVFQTARCLKSLGILKALLDKNNEGEKIEELQKSSQLSLYSLEVLLDAGVSCKLIQWNHERYYLTAIGYSIETEPLTGINMNFSHDVCYQGLFSLEESLKNNRPEGLKTFGSWSTIYEGLSELPAIVKKSWFEFDHFYSDLAFPKALNLVFQGKPKRILDVGGNTGKFAILCAQTDPEVEITIVDHAQQIKVARSQVNQLNLQNRIHFVECDLLKSKDLALENFDVVWMSQFLDCFNEDQIVELLNRFKNSLNAKGSIFILETLTDNQRFESAKFCLDMTSLYFTAMANGNSRMYPLKRMKELILKSGLQVEEIHDSIRLFHTLIKCNRED